MEKPSGGKLQEQGGVATIPCSPTEVSILRCPGTIKKGYHSMLNNPGEHSAASYIKDTLDTSPSLHPYIPTSLHPYMFTSVGEHGMIATPPCSWSFSTTWFFHAGTCVLQRHMAPSLHHFLFCGKRFYFPCFFAFSGVQAALWHVQPCTESKGRDCADNYTVYAL